jgi:hypothetical protein
MMNVNSVLQSAQNAELTEENDVFAISNLDRIRRIKVPSSQIAGGATRRHKLWRSQLPGKSGL